MSVAVLPPRWALQPFEADLARREVEVVTGTGAAWVDGALQLNSSVTSESVTAMVERLSFARAVSTATAEMPTVQAELERAAGGGARKVTSHALHGLHPYKGKFYPQLARSLVNVCDVPVGGRVLDPFAGCGTTILEAALLGIQGLGLDANPLATLVSETKLKLLGYPVADLREQLVDLQRLPVSRKALVDEAYLERWFPPENLAFLRRVLAGIFRLTDPVARDAALVILSSVLRRASLQEPTQLRVYRRKEDSFPEPLEELFSGALGTVVGDLAAVQSVPGLAWRRVRDLGSRIVGGDARCLRWTLDQLNVDHVDAVITSPPYANALPYVDTDRLSLRAFGLLAGQSQRAAEQKLIGNREVAERELAERTLEMEGELQGCSWLPSQLRYVLRASIDAAQEDDAGFRRRRTPALLYAYFRDMRVVLGDITAVVKPAGPVAVVIGDSNVTGPRGTTLHVPTADIIGELAQGVGMRLETDLSKRLTSFGASTTVHQRNAMESERVLLFRTGDAP